MSEVYIPNNIHIARRMTGIFMLIIGGGTDYCSILRKNTITNCKSRGSKIGAFGT